MLNNIMIAVSGKSGCGNTTVSKMVADKLGLQFINFTFRTLAKEKGVEFNKILDLAAKDDSWDREVDARQVQLAHESGGCVLGSRLAIWMLKEANLKVYLTASSEIRAARIVKREGGDIDEVLAFTTERDRRDRDRYIHLYNIDNNKYGFADIIINTDTLTPDQITKMIIDAAEKIQQ